MTSKENFELLMAELATILKIESLAADEFGIVTLDVDDKMPLYLMYSDRRSSILFTAELATVPANTPAEVFRELLAAQLFEQSSGGGYFALDNENGIITFQLEFMLANTPTSVFTETLENFINTCVHWQNAINNMLTATSSTTNQDDSPKEDTVLLRV